MSEYQQGQKVCAKLGGRLEGAIRARTFKIRKVSHGGKLCAACRGFLPPGTLHAVWGAWHFCLGCIEPLQEVMG
jgi:hypothetical protein